MPPETLEGTDDKSVAGFFCLIVLFHVSLNMSLQKFLAIWFDPCIGVQQNPPLYFRFTACQGGSVW